MTQALSDPQIQEREMVIQMEHPLSPSQPVNLIGNPIKLSETPATYRHPPPILGQHTEEILQQILGMTEEQTKTLRESGII